MTVLCVKSGCRPPRETTNNTAFLAYIHTWICLCSQLWKENTLHYGTTHILIHSLYHSLHLCCSRLSYMKGVSGGASRPGKMKEHDLTLMQLLDFKHRRQQQWHLARMCTIQPAGTHSSVTSPLSHGPPCQGFFVCRRGDQRSKCTGSL